MNFETIEMGNIESEQKLGRFFKESITVQEYDRICNSWKEELPRRFNWWYKYTPFAHFVLESCCIDTGSKIEMDRKNYWMFIPAMKRYFMTYKEYYTIVRNIAFLKKDIEIIFKDTNIFKIYNMMKLWGVTPSLGELLNMDLKIFNKLYLYGLGDRFIVPLKQKDTQEYVQ